MKQRKLSNSCITGYARLIVALMLSMFVYVTSTAQSTNGSSDEVFTAVEHTPEFPGGMDGFYAYLAKAIHYPAEAREKNIGGRVIVTFIVEKDGSLSHVKSLRSPDKGLEDEAVKVVSTSPKWIPGRQNKKVVRVQYTVPVVFTMVGSSPSKNTGSFDQSEAKAIYILDGKSISAEQLKGLDANNIKSVNVLKGKSATKKYGSKGMHGAVEITTKIKKK